MPDNIEKPEESRLEINQWVQNKTEDRIIDLIPPNVIGADTVLVLTNAVYFNAAWTTPFLVENTEQAELTTGDGSGVQVDMMQGSFRARGMERDGYTMFEMPYDGNELSMYVILPEPDTFAEVQALLNSEWLETEMTSLELKEIQLKLPKFEYDSALGLSDTLATMGMPSAMLDADFSGIGPGGGVVISDVVHKGCINVNEAGTEAAAATAVIVGETSIPESMTINVNRPFIFFIRDHKSNSTLFVGRVINPAS